MSFYNNTKNKSISSCLNKRIVIEESVSTPDGAGGFISSWVEFATVWAEIKPVSTDEKFTSMQVKNTATHFITVRYIDNLKESMRINYNSRIFKIISIINPLEKNRVLEVLAEENK